MPSRNKVHVQCGCLSPGKGPRRMVAAVGRMLKAARVHSGSLSVVFLTGPQMRALNRRALGHDFVTDVLTFDLGEGKRGSVEGEIFICPAEARRNARVYGEPFEREVMRYIAHGILHLTGHNDATPAQRQAMRKAEDKLLIAGSRRVR